jgi:hypothetical protein
MEARGLGAVSINVRITAVRKLAVEAADNGLLAPELANGMTRVKGVASKGVRLGNWLSVKQAQTLLNTPDVTTTKGMRDRAILAVLLGCGLRRSEVAALTVAHVQQRDGRWCIVDLVGKHGRVRTIPMPTWVKVAQDAWTAVAGVMTVMYSDREPWRSKQPSAQRAGLAVAQGCAAALRPGNCTPRSEKELREVVPCGGRRVGTDPVAVGPCVRADNGAVPRHKAGSGARAERRDQTPDCCLGFVTSACAQSLRTIQCHTEAAHLARFDGNLLRVGRETFSLECQLVLSRDQFHHCGSVASMVAIDKN